MIERKIMINSGKDESINELLYETDKQKELNEWKPK